MGVLVVHDQRDLFRVGIVGSQFPEKLRPVRFGLAFGGLDEPFAGQRFAGQKDVIDTAAFVLVIMPIRFQPCKGGPCQPRAERSAAPGPPSPFHLEG